MAYPYVARTYFPNIDRMRKVIGECPICLEEVTYAQTIAMHPSRHGDEHRLCKDCIDELMKSADEYGIFSCPLCRDPTGNARYMQRRYCQCTRCGHHSGMRLPSMTYREFLPDPNYYVLRCSPYCRVPVEYYWPICALCAEDITQEIQADWCPFCRRHASAFDRPSNKKRVLYDLLKGRFQLAAYIQRGGSHFIQMMFALEFGRDALEKLLHPEGEGEEVD